MGLQLYSEIQIYSEKCTCISKIAYYTVAAPTKNMCSPVNIKVGLRKYLIMSDCL